MPLTTAIGLMSGTSMDGIDLALVTSDGAQSVARGPSFFVPYEAAFRKRITAALDDARQVEQHDERPGDLADLEREVTHRHARAVAQFRTRLPAGDQPSLIGFHGQTVLHRPEQALTVQLGDGALLAAETGLPVVYDMRAADMAAGGQGAPLVPAYHAALAHSLPDDCREFPVCFVNVGGISNITWIGEGGEPVAFDSGPGNALIDQWVQASGGVPFDQDGMIAAEGGVVREVVDRYLASAFFQKRGPKSLDRNDFTLDLARGLELADGARTLAAVSAEAILAAASHVPTPPKLWILCGGGRKNPHILADMRRGADKRGARVLIADDVALDGDAMEAEAWAYLAIRSRVGMPLTWPATTGCRQPTCGGRLAVPG